LLAELLIVIMIIWKLNNITVLWFCRRTFG